MALGRPPLVYDVTSYMDYHPGGRGELLRGAGTDATQLFNEYHAWINFQHILGSVLVGTLDRRKGGGDLRPSQPHGAPASTSKLGIPD